MDYVAREVVRTKFSVENLELTDGKIMTIGEYNLK
jgi:hypothetical protein